QLYLFFGEWTHSAARQGQCPDGNAFPHQRDTKHGAPASQALLFRLIVLGVCQNVRDVDYAPFKRYAPDEGFSSRRKAIMPQPFLVLIGITAACGHFIEAVGATTENVRAFRFA